MSWNLEFNLLPVPYAVGYARLKGGGIINILCLFIGPVNFVLGL